MNQVFLILAHKMPQQLHKLITQLESPVSYFFIHLDLKCNIDEFKSASPLVTNVHFIEERYRIDWGSFNMVKATLALLKEVEKSNITYSHVHLLSGEDLRIKSIENLEKYFTEHAEFSFLNHFPLPCPYWPQGGMNRITEYHFDNSPKNILSVKKIILKAAAQFLNKIAVPIFPFLRKKPDKNIIYHGGSQWWSLNSKSLGFILQFIENHPDFVKFFKFSFIPDEIFFHTILLNSDLKLKIICDNKRYIDWLHPEKGFPAYFCIDDYETLLQTDAFFARKLDFTTSVQLYEMFC
jgi:hypothetical protein